MLELIGMIAEKGFNAIELECNPCPEEVHGIWAREADHEFVEKLKEAVSGFKEVSFHAPYHFFDVNIISPNPFVRKLSVEEIIFVMELANALGRRNVTVHTGAKNPLLKDPVINEYLRETLTALNDAAVKNDVMIGVEVVDYFYCPKRFELIEELALSNVGITLDIGHLCFPQPELGGRPGFSQYGSIEGVIRRYAKLIRHVHIHDFSFARNKDHLAFGDGNLDMISIVNTLRNNGFDGTLLMELTPLVPMEKILSGKKLLEKITDWKQ